MKELSFAALTALLRTDGVVDAMLPADVLVDPYMELCDAGYVTEMSRLTQVGALARARYLDDALNMMEESWTEN